MYLLIRLIISCPLIALCWAGLDDDMDFGYQVVCYYSVVESWYRRGRAMYMPKNVDTHLCTHINYDNAVLDPETLMIAPRDSWADIDNHLYENVTVMRLQNPTLRIMLSLGGWSERSEKYSRLAADPRSRSLFVDGVVKYLKKYEFDGLDIAWFYPGCWDFGKNCSSSNPSDKRNFVQLIKELREAFDRETPRLQLSIAVSSDPHIMKRSYDIPALSQLVDVFNVRTFDFYTSTTTTGHNSAFYGRPSDSNPLANSNTSLYYWVKSGAPKRKLNMGVPTYGRTFTLRSPREVVIGSRVLGNGALGEFSKTEGILTYYEICDRIENHGWTKIVDKTNGPYAFKDDQWVSYDDPETVDQKGEYVKEHNFAGMAIWDMDRDDFKGSCYGVKSPLTRAAHIALLH